MAYKRKNPPFSIFIPTLNPSHQSKAGRDILYPQPSRLIFDSMGISFFDNYFMNLMKSYVEYSLNIYVA